MQGPIMMGNSNVWPIKNAVKAGFSMDGHMIHWKFEKANNMTSIGTYTVFFVSRGIEYRLMLPQPEIQQFIKENFDAHKNLNSKYDWYVIHSYVGQSYELRRERGLYAINYTFMNPNYAARNG
jgi:hypothetical protein